MTTGRLFVVILFITGSIPAKGQFAPDTLNAEDTVIMVQPLSTVFKVSDTVLLPWVSIDNCLETILEPMVSSCASDVSSPHDFLDYLFYCKRRDSVSWVIYVSPIPKVTYHGSSRAVFEVKSFRFFLSGDTIARFFTDRGSKEFLMFKRSDSTKIWFGNWDVGIEPVQHILVRNQITYYFLLQPCKPFSRRERQRMPQACD